MGVLAASAWVEFLPDGIDGTARGTMKWKPPQKASSQLGTTAWYDSYGGINELDRFNRFMCVPKMQSYDARTSRSRSIGALAGSVQGTHRRSTTCQNAVHGA